MKVINLASLLCAFCFVFGCTKQEPDIRVPEFEIPVIHGYYVRDGTGLLVGAYGYGVPNVRLGDIEDFFLSRYFLVIYPNPPIANILNVFVKSPFENQVKKLWITHAILRPPFDAGIVPYDDWNNFIAGGAPVFQLEFTQNEIRIDVSRLNDGYYRIYLKVDNQVFYDNLVINKQFTGL